MYYLEILASAGSRALGQSIKLSIGSREKVLNILLLLFAAWILQLIGVLQFVLPAGIPKNWEAAAVIGTALLIAFPCLFVFALIEVVQERKATELESKDKLAILFSDKSIADDPRQHTIFRVTVSNKSSETIPEVRAYCCNLKYLSLINQAEAERCLSAFKSDVPLSLKSGYSKINPESSFKLLPFDSEEVDVIKLNRATGKIHLCHAIGEWCDPKELIRDDINLRGGLARRQDDTIPFGDYRLDIRASAENASPVVKSFKITATYNGKHYIEVKEIESEDQLFSGA